jgi:hypothetical protein
MTTDKVPASDFPLLTRLTLASIIRYRGRGGCEQNVCKIAAPNIFEDKEGNCG